MYNTVCVFTHKHTQTHTCGARTVVAHCLIGGPNSLGGQGRERRGLSSSCSLTFLTPPFSSSSLASILSDSHLSFSCPGLPLPFLLLLAPSVPLLPPSRTPSHYALQFLAHLYPHIQYGPSCCRVSAVRAMLRLCHAASNHTDTEWAHCLF